jgi:uncharacterized protein (TIGR00299 family) protein
MAQMHIHLDPVGGVAGDMFVAAFLDAFPDLTEKVMNTVRHAGLDEDVMFGIVPFTDGILTGTKFKVSKSVCQTAQASTHSHHHHHHDDDHDHDHHHHHHGRETYQHSHDHGHTHWAELRARLQATSIQDNVKRHVLGIFGELAGAEAKVHGKEPDAVSFHEVGNWDSIADIVAAATIIDALSPESWSIGSLPIGRGLVSAAHGELPVPAPATMLLLNGFSFHDDGRTGERVTPTGAAILRYVSPANGIGASPRILRRSGYGFGERKLRGMSNTLRVLAFDLADVDATTDFVGIIQFEIDDQTGEELAAALDHIREHSSVLDVTQSMVMGKKGRMMAAVQVLTEPSQIDAVSRFCFQQTTTLGLRTRVETRSILERREVQVRGTRVKIADRPGGPTAKAEMDEVAMNRAGHKARSAARQAAESEALKA